MPTNSESVSSIYSLGVPLSVKSQTKEKFDALLKIAQKKKSGKSHVSVSKEKLLNEIESTSASSENLLDKVEEIQLNELNTSRHENYILNKFLDDPNKNKFSGEEEREDSVKIKPPVPKPRKKKCISPTLSQGTFEVTSPKVVQKSDQNKEPGSPSSTKTYNVEEIGDVIIHKSPTRPKIVKRISSKNLDLDNDNSESTTSHRTLQNDDEKIIVEATRHTSNQKESVDELSNDDSASFKENRKEKTKSKRSDENESRKKYKYERIVEVIVHKTDRLQLSSLVIHPVVKIHVVDVSTGKYFPKSDKSRSVVFFYENNDNDYISPVMTHTCNLQEKRVLYPSWEESILLNEDYEYLKDESNHIVMFFEVLDFVPVAMLQQLHEKDCVKGWHNIAFAFLKLSGKGESLNIGKTTRLQLYYAHHSKKNNPQVCNPWVWWKKKKLKKYPSTLHVTIKPAISPTTVLETFRSKTPIQRETSSKTKLCDEVQDKAISDLQSVASSYQISAMDKKAEFDNWKRNPRETCKLPNKCLSQFNSSQGCFVMKFSHNGAYLACAVEVDNLFYIVLYSILSLREADRFSSHQALIYDIKWSNDDSLLLSASADNTISVFHLLSSSLFQILPHPSFVYSCDISNGKTIASGCYDGTVRIWNSVEDDARNEFHLFQELEAHAGYVTSLCFDKKSSLFSADSTGVIIEWQQEEVDWILKRQITLLDLKETIINQILLFPKHKKLLIESRDSTIRIIDIKSGCVLQWLRGALNKRFKICCAISPCGTYVYSGSENGFVHVWNSKNGHEIATYVPFASDHHFLTIHCVDFHPHDNILAISHYGKNSPVLLYCFDRDVKEPSVSITFKEGYDAETQKTEREPNKYKSKFQKIARKCEVDRDEEKLDFRGVLKKMDSIITFQKSQ